MHELQQILLKKIPRLLMEEPLSHNHILEALGEDWAMTGDYQLLFRNSYNYTEQWGKYTYETGGKIMDLPKLPSNISDLSLPEYEETRKQLISLLK